MAFDNLVAVFGCSIVTKSKSKTFGFNTVSATWEKSLEGVIGFNIFKVFLRCLQVKYFLFRLFGFFTVFDALQFLNSLTFNLLLSLSLSLVFPSFSRVSVFLVNSVANNTKYIFSISPTNSCYLFKEDLLAYNNFQI